MTEQAEADLEARVVALVEARRDQLAELVRHAVDTELEQLVDAELAQRSNGPAHADNVVRREEPSLRRCNRCGQEKPPTDYDKHRGTCKSCRRQEARDREHRPAPAEPPRPSP